MRRDHLPHSDQLSTRQRVPSFARHRTGGIASVGIDPVCVGSPRWCPGIGAVSHWVPFWRSLPVSQIILPSLLFVPPVTTVFGVYVACFCPLALVGCAPVPGLGRLLRTCAGIAPNERQKAVWHVPRCHSQPDTLRGFRLGSATSGCFCRGGHGEQQKQPETAEGDNHHEAGRNQPENKRGSRVSR